MAANVLRDSCRFPFTTLVVCHLLTFTSLLSAKTTEASLRRGFLARRPEIPTKPNKVPLYLKEKVPEFQYPTAARPQQAVHPTTDALSASSRNCCRYPASLQQSQQTLDSPPCNHSRVSIGRSLLSFTDRLRAQRRKERFQSSQQNHTHSPSDGTPPLSLFTLPLPFDGPAGPPQRLALLSWLALEPKPVVYLLGNHPSFFKITQEPPFAGHVFVEPFVDANVFGQPLFNSVLARAAAASGGTSASSSVPPLPPPPFGRPPLAALVRPTALLLQAAVAAAVAAREEHPDFLLMAPAHHAAEDAVSDDSGYSSGSLKPGFAGQTAAAESAEIPAGDIEFDPTIFSSRAAEAASLSPGSPVALWLWSVSDCPLMDPAPSSESPPPESAPSPLPQFLPPLAFDRGYHDVFVAAKLLYSSGHASETASGCKRKLILPSVEAHASSHSHSGSRSPSRDASDLDSMEINPPDATVVADSLTSPILSIDAPSVLAAAGWAPEALAAQEADGGVGAAAASAAAAAATAHLAAWGFTGRGVRPLLKAGRRKGETLPQESEGRGRGVGGGRVWNCGGGVGEGGRRQVQQRSKEAGSLGSVDGDCVEDYGGEGGRGRQGQRGEEGAEEGREGSWGARLAEERAANWRLVEPHAADLERELRRGEVLLLRKCGGKYCLVSRSPASLCPGNPTPRNPNTLANHADTNPAADTPWYCTLFPPSLPRPLPPLHYEQPAASLSAQITPLLPLVVRHRSVVTLVAASHSYAAMLMSFVCNLRRLLLPPPLIAAFDAKIYGFAKARGLPVFQVVGDSGSRGPTSKCSFGSPCFKRLTKVKSRLVLHLLRMGVTVLWSDIDIVWFRDPLPDMVSFGPGVFPVQSDAGYDNEPPNGKGLISPHGFINSGFYFARAEPMIIQAFEKIVQHASGTDTSEQPSFYAVLCGPEGEYTKSNETCVWPENGLEVVFLPRQLHPNGLVSKIWFKKKPVKFCERLGCASLHNNWIRGRERKMRRLQAKGLLFYDEQNDMCRYDWYYDMVGVSMENGTYLAVQSPSIHL